MPGMCSGIVAGAGFQALSALPQAEHTVYLMGPAHWLPVYGVGLSSASAFTTPLGAVSVHAEQVRALAARRQAVQPVRRGACAGALPGSGTALLTDGAAGCRIVPMLFDDGAQPERIAADLGERLASDPHSIVVVSSDLSHYQPYAQAQKVDRTFLDAVASGDVATAAKGQACGLQPILCLMILARQLGWTAHVLDYRNSGDTCGPRSEVVGYGSVIFVP